MKAAGIVIGVAVVVALSGRAHAYPQFQLSRDATCTGCHLSPAGGGLLNEMGLVVAEQMSSYGTSAEFFYGKVPTPKWLTLGGDLRGATGFIQTPEKAVAAFPMQIEAYGHATFGQFSVHVTAGSRPATVGNEAITHLWAREHYVMWQQKPGEGEGMYVRAGRFMPVIGLRWAEHPMYTRRYGGTQLWADTYGLAAEYVTKKVEAHVTGFIKDPFIDSVEHVNGAAAYVELRTSDHGAIGAEGMIELGDNDKKFRGGVTSKIYIPGPELLLSGELQFVNQRIEGGGAPNQLVGNLMASKMIGDTVLLDLGIGHFDSNIRIRDLDRDCVDLNLHWFTTSHLELVVNARYELIGFGNSPAGAYAIAQAHYRL